MTVSCAWNAHEPITDDWLKSMGFRWHEVEGDAKHWVLWLGDVVREGGFASTEDLGVELSSGHTHDKYFCWLRGDYSHRYSRFIHVRHLRLQCELLRLIEGLTGEDWKPGNVWHGSLVTDKQAEFYHKEKERLDVKFIESAHSWNELEKDATRGYPLWEHQDLLLKKDKTQ